MGGSTETLKLPTYENQISTASPQGNKQPTGIAVAQQSSRTSVGVPSQGSNDNLQESTVSRREVWTEVSLRNKVGAAACRQPRTRAVCLGCAEQSRVLPLSLTKGGAVGPQSGPGSEPHSCGAVSWEGVKIPAETPSSFTSAEERKAAYPLTNRAKPGLLYLNVLPTRY